MPNTHVPAAAEGLPGFHHHHHVDSRPAVPALHPLFLDAQRLLAAMPVIDTLDIRDDEVRIVAARYAQRRLAEEATDRLIALLDELEPDPDLEPSLEHMPGELVDGEGEDDNGVGDAGGLSEQVDGEPDVDAEEDDPSEDNGDAEPDVDREPNACGVTVSGEDAMQSYDGAVERPERKRRRQAPSGYLIDYDPRNLPESYVMEVDGVCMEPEIANGTMLRFDRTLPPKSGDVVVFYYRRDRVPPGEHQARVKRLAAGLHPGMTFPYEDHPGSDVDSVLLFEMNNPRRGFAVWCRDILAVHKCVGPAEKGTIRKMSAEEQARMRITRGMPAI